MDMIGVQLVDDSTEDPLAWPIRGDEDPVSPLIEEPPADPTEELHSTDPTEFQVELHSTDQSAVEATRSTISMLSVGAQLVLRGDRYYISGGDARYVAWACERQGYVRRVIR